MSKNKRGFTAWAASNIKPLAAGAVIAGCLICPLSQARADEGMFLFDNPPQQLLKERYGVTLSKDWLDKAMHAAVRFNNGGSGSFISSDGLVMTNHHVASGALYDLSTPEHDLFAEGFLAKTRDQERKVPNLELNCLQSIEDVTKRVQGAVTPDMTSEQAALARAAEMSRIEKESLEKTGLRSDVVTLYQGGAYHLYRYKKYTDIRLVWAPEQDAASFGGDVDNFEYPRRALDVTFFRVYENGKPLKPDAYLSVNAEGAKDGDVVFVAGHPGSTSRLNTYGDMVHYRDFTAPWQLSRLRNAEAAMRQYSERGAEESRQAFDLLGSYENSRKVYTDVFRGLMDPAVMGKAKANEEALKQGAATDNPWQVIDMARAGFAPNEESYFFLEAGYAFSSRTFSYARDIVRLAEEIQKPNAERLREYRDSNLDSLKMEILGAEAIYPGVEQARLQASFSYMAERLGGEHPDVQLVLDGKAHDVRARELAQGTKLYDVKERQRLLDGGMEAVKASDDPMIKLALQVDERSRQLRRKYENECQEPCTKAYERIAAERFRQLGSNVPPDATFTLRLAFGEVKGYSEEGHEVDWCTHIGDYYKVYRQHNGAVPFDLPQSWKNAENTVDKDAQLVFVSTADITGGNSGSPVLGKDGRWVGVAFDGNRYSSVNKFVYGEEQARCLSIAAPAILESLRHVYGGENILQELGVK